MRRGVRHGSFTIVLAALVLASGSGFVEPAAAADGRQLAKADCDDIDLRVGAAVGEQTCRAASMSDNDARARVESVSALGAGTIFLAEHINAGLHTYVRRSAPGDIAESTGLHKAPSGPETRFAMQGFDVLRFKDKGGMYCAAFVKHWSRVPRTPAIAIASSASIAASVRPTSPTLL